MGGQKGQMNLSALRNRAEDLRRSIDRLIHTMQFAADRLQWADTLEQYAVMNVQYQYLMDQLRPLLKHWVAHPKSVNQSNAPLLPIMLATKVLPEMEAEEAALLQALPLQGGDPKAQLPAIVDQTEVFNSALDRLTLHTPPSSHPGPLDPRGGRRKELAVAVAKAGAARAAGAPAGGGGAGPRGLVARLEGGKLEGGELLLAAASYGAGV